MEIMDYVIDGEELKAIFTFASRMTIQKLVLKTKLLHFRLKQHEQGQKKFFEQVILNEKRIFSNTPSRIFNYIKRRQMKDRINLSFQRGQKRILESGQVNYSLEDATRNFQHRLKMFVKNVIKNQFGPMYVIHYSWKIEF